MLLRGGGLHTGGEYSFTGIIDGESETGVPHGNLLGRFADAVHAGDFAAERAEVERTLGWEALVDAAGTVAIFAAVVKVADATGIPLEDFKAEASAGFRAELGIDGFARTWLRPRAGLWMARGYLALAGQVKPAVPSDQETTCGRNDAAHPRKCQWQKKPSMS